MDVNWQSVSVLDLSNLPVPNECVEVFIIDGIVQLGREVLSVDIAQVLLRIRMKHSDLQIAKDRLGKPFVLNYPVHVSISHAADVLVIAFAAVDLGIDIDRLRHPTRWRTLYDWVNAPEDRIPDPVPNDFLRCWTAKEALVKLIGKGLNYGLQRISLPFRSLGPDRGGQSAYQSLDIDGRLCWFTHLARHDDWIVALAVAQPLPVRTFAVTSYCHDK